jgi:hypothetical protein
VPTISYGDDWIYEGDRTSGGTEGAWTLTQGGGGAVATQTVDSGNNLAIAVTTRNGDASTVHANNLGLATTTYARIRVRYKCTNSDGTVQGKVATNVGDITGMTALTSTTWTTVDAALPTGTTNLVTLYNKTLTGNGLGTVTYDFVQIYKGNYVFPNTVSLTKSFSVFDALIPVPGRMGDITQSLGTHLVEIRSVHNLNMEFDTVRWTLPQATGTTSYDNEDVLLELLHYGGNTHLWHWLDLGAPTQQFKVRLVELQTSYEGGGDTAECLWREYRHGSASETVSERFGLTL